MSGAQAPSPWLFALALPLGLAAGMLLLWRTGGTDQVYAERFYDVARLRRLEGPGPLRVVALGSSTVSQALPFDAELEAMGAASGRPLRFVRFSRNARRLDTVPELLERIQQHPPDLLVTEAEWLAWGNAPDTLRGTLKHRRRRLFLALRLATARLLGAAPAMADGQEDNRPGPQLHFPPFNPAQYVEATRVIPAQDPARAEAVLAGLERLRRGGCRVVVLAMGRSPDAAALLPPEQAAIFSATVDRLAARGFPVAWPDLALPQACYQDHGHLNGQGRARFSAWFLSRLEPWSARP